MIRKLVNLDIFVATMTDWLILLHQLGPRSAYLRVKVWRRLRALGAVQVGTAAHALPSRADTHEEFRRIAEEITLGGGSAAVAEARFVSGMNEGQVVSRFQGARDRDYAELAASLPGLRPGVQPTRARRAELAAALGRARRRLRSIQAIDFYGAPGRKAAAAAIEALEHRLIPSAGPRPTPGRVWKPAELVGRVWVTRRGVHVDRLACAWLIRRFIDSQARFRFVPGLDYRRKSRELRFDMAEAEFTHVGARCSFEVLVERTGLADPALTAVGEIVHDLDLSDEAFRRPETAGIERVLAGIIAGHADDLARIARASAMFDDLYESFRRPARRRRDGAR